MRTPILLLSFLAFACARGTAGPDTIDEQKPYPPGMDRDTGTTMPPATSSTSAPPTGPNTDTTTVTDFSTAPEDTPPPDRGPKPARCGDGILDPGEQCDDGNRVDDDTCLADCRLPLCGNGVADAGEWCVTREDLDLGMHRPGTLATGDLDHDGLLDLIAGASNSHAVVRLLSDATGGFGTPKAYLSGKRPIEIAVTDLDDDGSLDVLTLSEDDFQIRVLAGDGTGGLRSAKIAIDGFIGRAFAIGHANLDGAPDVILETLFFESGPGDTLLARSGANVYAGAAGSTPAYSRGIALGGPPTDLLLADMTGDNIQDLVVPITAPARVRLFSGTGNEEFTATSFVNLPDPPVTSALADMDADGQTDIVVLTERGQVYVLFTASAGGFVPELGNASISGPGEIAVADFNGDGWADLALAPRDQSIVSLLAGDGSAGFAPLETMQLAAPAQDLVAADFNGDDRAELAVAVAEAQRVALLVSVL